MNPKILQDWLARILSLIGILQENEEAEASIANVAPSSKCKTEEATTNADEAARVPATEQSGEIVPLDEQARRMLRDIRKFASWSGEDGTRLLKEILDAFAMAYPGHEQEVEMAIEQGKHRGILLERAFKSAATYGIGSSQVQAIRIEAAREDSWTIQKIEEKIERGEATRQRHRNTRSPKKDPRAPMKPRTAGPVVSTLNTKQLAVRRSPLAVPLGLHGSDLRAQTPSSKWTVVIDESGAEFGAEAASFKSAKQGRFVAVAIPGSNPTLPALLPKAWHAVDCTDDREIDEVFQAVLSAEAAVFGATVTSLPITPGERWADGVSLLIDWTLRLLPVDGPTKVEFLIENRGMFQRGDLWPLVERDCLRRFALAFPQTAGWIDLRIKVVGKNDCDFGGYADAVAFTWARTSPESEARMRESQLAGTCLLESDALTLLHAWDSFAQGVRLPGPDWWNLLPETSNPASLTATLLDHIGTECRADTSRWSVYLDEARRQMAAGAVELSRLADATAWLERFLPAEAAIPPLMRLAWLVVKLARSNHYGEAESAWENEVAALAPTLLEEAAPMVCHADLHLAVARTNRFDFDGASRALERWHDMPAQVPGLRYWAQVRSSLGQHAAYQGDQAAAVALFDEALAAFGRLSDPAVRDKEAAQTGAYRAIALMDLVGASGTDVRKAVEKITGPLGKAIPSLATSGSPSKRYAHHLLLRWLVCYGQPAEKSAYLDQRANWKTGHGHPWPLIQIYRALLLHPTDAEAARQVALDAADLAFSAEQGPVVRLIGACCRTIAVGWGESWPESESELAWLNANLPAANHRIAMLRTAIAELTTPLDLIIKTLPFNFR
jgi:hypothetical protein